MFSFTLSLQLCILLLIKYGASSSLAQYSGGFESLSPAPAQQPSWLTPFRQLPKQVMTQFRQAFPTVQAVPEQSMMEFRQPYPTMQAAPEQSMTQFRQPYPTLQAVANGGAQTSPTALVPATSALQVEAQRFVVSQAMMQSVQAPVPQAMTQPVQAPDLLGRAGVPVEDMLKLHSTMEALSSRTQILEQQLEQTREAKNHFEEQAAEANARSEESQREAAIVSESLKKTGPAAELSVNAAKESTVKEHVLVEKLTQDLEDRAKADADLKAQLHEAQTEEAKWKEKASDAQTKEDNVIRTFQAALKERDEAAEQASEMVALASEAALAKESASMVKEDASVEHVKNDMAAAQASEAEVLESEAASEGMHRLAVTGPRQAEPSQLSAALESFDSSAITYSQQQQAPSYLQLPAQREQTSQATVADYFEEQPRRQSGFLSRRH